MAMGKGSGRNLMIIAATVIALIFIIVLFARQIG
jgi:hypothetical protein